MTGPIHISFHHEIDIYTWQYPYTSGHETGHRTVTWVSTHAHKTYIHELVIVGDGSQEVWILSAEGQLRGSGHVGHHWNMKRVGESSNICCGCAAGCSNDTCTQQDCLQWYLHTTPSTMIPAHNKTVYNDTCTPHHLQWYLHTRPSIIPAHNKIVYNDTCTHHPQSQHYYLHTTPTVPALLPAHNTHSPALLPAHNTHSPSTTTCTHHPQSQHYYLHTTPTVPVVWWLSFPVPIHTTMKA